MVCHTLGSSERRRSSSFSPERTIHEEEDSLQAMEEGLLPGSPLSSQHGIREGQICYFNQKTWLFDLKNWVSLMSD